MLKYILVGILSVTIFLIGYRMFTDVSEKACDTDISRLGFDLRNLHKDLRLGALELKSFNLGCRIDSIYIFDLRNFKGTSAGAIPDIPIMKDSIESGNEDNVFLIRKENVLGSFKGGNFEIADPYYFCLIPRMGKVSILAGNLGEAISIALPEGQLQC